MSDFLEIELRLLLLKYGRKRLWEGLACLENVSIEDVERRIDELAKTPPARKRKELPSLDESVTRLNIVDDDIKQRVMALAREYERGRFLPQLRDAIRFCQMRGVKTRAKSRREMLPKIVAILATLPVAMLDELIANAGDGEHGKSSFARLAKAIMGGT